MAHKTKVNGTVYEVSGGKTKVNGTGYSIKGGRTKVNGTGYGINFGKPVTVTVTGTGDASHCYASYDGTIYTSGTFTAYTGNYISLHLWNRGVQLQTNIDGDVYSMIGGNLNKSYLIPENATSVSIILNFVLNSYTSIQVTTRY